jgi:hypothetical protein
MNEERSNLILPPSAGQLVVPAQAQIKMVDLGNGMKAPLAEVLASANPDCRYCTGGIQRVTVGEVTTERLCGCAVRGVLRKMRGDDPTPTVVVSGNEKYLGEKRRHAEKKLAKLRTERETVAAEHAQRVQGADAGIDEARVNTLAARETLEWEQQRGQKAVDDLEQLKQELAEAEEAVRGQLAIVKLAQARLDERQRELLAVEDRKTEILQEVEHAQHKLGRLDAQISLHLQKHPELGQ